MLRCFSPTMAQKRSSLLGKKRGRSRKEIGKEREHRAKHLFDCYLGAMLSNYQLEHLKKLITDSQGLKAVRQTWSQVRHSALWLSHHHAILHSNLIPRQQRWTILMHKNQNIRVPNRKNLLESLQSQKFYFESQTFLITPSSNSNLLTLSTNFV